MAPDSSGDLTGRGTRRTGTFATVKGRGLFRPWTTPRLPRRVTIEQKTYLIDGRRVARVTAPDGSAVPWFTEMNFDHQARAVAHMPHGQTLRFPVQGTTRMNAVMTATDDSDLPVFRIRRVRSAGPGQERKNMVEIAVEPGSQITDELLLVMVAGYRNLHTFFNRPGGG